MPQTILYIITLSEWGGASKYVFDLATALKNNPNYIPFVAVGGRKDGELIQRLLRTNIKTYYLRHLKRKINLYNDYNAFWSIFKLCRQVKPDVVHLNSSKAGSLGALAARLAGVKKIVYTVHGLVLNEPISLAKKCFYWLAEKISGWCKDRFICVSEYDQKSLLKFKICSLAKTELIHNGIAIEEIHFFSRAEAIAKLHTIIRNINPTYNLQLTSYKLVGTIANLYPNKGLPYLIEAAREATAVDDRLKFIIIGEGPERQKLETIIQNYHLENDVFLAGRIPDAKKLLPAFAIFVLSSLKEGLAYSLLDACAAGLPIIATDVGGNPEIISHKENGLIVPVRDFSALGAAVLQLAREEKTRVNLGLEAKKTIDKFSFARMLDLTLGVYKMA